MMAPKHLDIPSHVSFANGQTVPQYYKTFTNFMNHQASLHRNRVFASYCSRGTYKSLTYAQVDHLAINLACKWADLCQGVETVSVLADHNVGYVIILLAILKLRVKMMAVSPRNSEAAVINLLEKTGSKLLLAYSKFSDIASSSAAKVEGVKFVPIDLDIDSLIQEPLNPDCETILNTNFSDDDIEKCAMIYHSSGSTSFPKPIYLSNRYLFNMINGLHIAYNSRDDVEKLDNNDTFCSITPLFHIFGFFVVFSAASFGGKAVFLEKLPASQHEIDTALSVNRCTVLSAPPVIYENMMSYLLKKAEFSTVRRLKLAVYGGAPLHTDIGEWFYEQGVKICSYYGTTETGALLAASSDPSCRNFFSVAPYLRDPNGNLYAVMETNDPSEPDIKHCYVRGDCPSLANGISNRTGGGFNTNDLFRENINNPGYYDYIGRRDDTLIMDNGEKTNPIPIEAALRQSDVIRQAAVLGHGRKCTLALIEIDMNYAIQLTPGEIIAEVQKAVKRANQYCPSHSTILSQMIIILPLNKTLPVTDKGSLMRKKAEQFYQATVDKNYKNFIEGSFAGKASNVDTSKWSAGQIQSFVADCAVDVLQVPSSKLNDYNQSLFDLGLNSLLSIQLRSRVSEYFHKVPQNFMYQNPSINSMVEALLNGFEEDTSKQIEKRYEQTQNLAKKYLDMADQDFPVARNSYTEKKDKVIMLTGVTGSLGSFMLRDLLLDSTVKKVYAMVRGEQEQLQHRLLNAFKSRELDTSLLATDRVEVLPMKFNEPFLGLNEEKYDQLKQEVTIIQHCAWLLDFNMPVDHYDRECIAPFYNLLKFAYNQFNPMHVHFISSISASAAMGSTVKEFPLPFDSHVCMPMGYAHSKFIVEVLFNFLMTKKNFPCYIERLGQVCGDSENGVWNISEQYPLMFIGGGSVMHKMPALDTVIDWITVDYAAASIVEIMLRTASLPAKQNDSVYHIVNPQTIHWKSVLQAMKDANMNFDIVSPSEWVEELAKDTTNPAYTLMSFYEFHFKEAFQMPIWETTKTSKIAPRLSQSPTLDSSLFGKFLKRWESIGFYKPSM